MTTENPFRTPKLEKTSPRGSNWTSGSWGKRDLALWVGCHILEDLYELGNASVIQVVARKVPDPGFTHHREDLPDPGFPALGEWLTKMAEIGRPYIGVMIWERED